MNKYAFLIPFVLLGGLALYGQAANDSFFSFCGDAARKSAHPRTIAGVDNWFFFKPELLHLSKKAFWGKYSASVSAAQKPEWKDPLPAIVDFNRQLQKRGITLYFVPVPAKAIVYPDKLKGSRVKAGGRRLDDYHERFYALLRSAGVNVVDLTPLFLAHRNDGDGPVYCKTDTHWSGLACELAAGDLAKKIKAAGWYARAATLALSAKRTSIRIAGDLVPDKAAAVKEVVTLRKISLKKDASPVEPRDSSPVLLLGDSHTLVFHAGGDMYAQGAGLADQLAYDLGFPVDLIGVRGSGSTATRVNLYRKSRSDPNYLSGKKVVIWCLSVREFTESTEGWRIVPIAPGN